MENIPKRRKLRDNPYTLLIENNKYYIIFKDNKNILHKEKVERNVFEAFNTFELEDKKIMNEYSRHIENSLLYENKLEVRIKDKPLTIEEEIIKKSSYEELMSAIKKLTDVQQRRIKMYYFDELDTKMIAKLEKCSSHSVRVSIRRAIEELAKLLKK